MDESSLLIDTKNAKTYTSSSPIDVESKKESKSSKCQGLLRNMLLIFMVAAVGFVLFDHAIFDKPNSGSINVNNDVGMSSPLPQEHEMGKPVSEFGASKLARGAGVEGVAGPAGAAKREGAASGTSSPNIVFILMDDMGFSDMSARGSEYSTPNLDSLYEESIIIDNHYIGLVCSPSRSQIITGRYAWNMGLAVQAAFHKSTIVSFPAALPTVGDLLTEYGDYEAYFTGKWHMGYSTEEHLPLGRGFSKFYGFYTSTITYSDKTALYGDDDDAPAYIDWRDNEDVDYDTQYEYSTYVTGDKILDIINSHLSDDTTKDKPFYIHAPFQGFHSILETVDSDNSANCDVITKAYEISHSETASDGSEMSMNFLYENEDDYFQDQGEVENQVMEPVDDDTVDTTDYTDEDYMTMRKLMCENVLAFDQVLGDLIDNLKNTHNVWDNTIIVFTSDNGATFNAGGCNYPLRGTKDSFFEGGVRTVAFVAGGVISDQIEANKKLKADLGLGITPKSKTQETRSGAFMHGTDWTPTILGFAGLDVTEIKQVLQNKLYIPVAKQASLNEHNSEDYYKDYLMSNSFDGNDVSQWILTGDSDLNPRTSYVPLSVNTIDATMSADEGVNGDSYPSSESAVIFTSSNTNHLYKFMYLNDEVKHGQRQVHYCTFRTVTDEETGEEYQQRTQTVSSFASANVFLFDFTLDYAESTNLLELLLTSDDDSELTADDELNKAEETESNKRRLSIDSLDDYDSETVSLLWDEALALINDEFIENNVMFNSYMTCQQNDEIEEADPSLLNDEVSTWYTWDEYTSKFDELCSESVNPVLSVMYTTRYTDY